MTQPTVPESTEEYEIPEDYALPEACENKPGMVDWLNEEGADEDESCRPCAVPTAGKWYIEEFTELGLTEEAEELQAFMEQDAVDPLQLAEKLDNIKETAHPGLHNRFRELDCSVQVNVDSIAEEQEDG